MLVGKRALGVKICPKCGIRMREIADWQGDWVFCPNCLKTEKISKNEMV